MNGFMRWIGAFRRRICSRAAAVPTSPRNLEWEVILCAAIRDNVLVALRYRNASGRDVGFQYFGPSAVYYGNERLEKVMVSGDIFFHPDDVVGKLSTFEVARIVELRPTEITFQPDRRFDRTFPKYRHGFIC